MQKHYLVILKRIILLMVVYSFLRLLFLALNWPTYQKFDISNLLISFIKGLRYDLSIIAIINLIFILLASIPLSFISKIKYQSFLNYFFLISNIPFFWLSIIDIDYYKFIGRRTNFGIIGIANDAIDQSINLSLKYWHIPLICIGVSLIFFYLNNRFINHKLLISEKKLGENKAEKYLFSFLPILFLGLCILAFRGGFQTKPLRINMAFSQNSNELGNLVLNSPFTFLTTSTIKDIEKTNFLSEKEMKFYFPKNSLSAHFQYNKKQNIVIIIVESLAKEYLGSPKNGTGYTPFLDSLSGMGISMQNHFANGRESIDAVPAILASVPRLMDEPFITSRYQSNKIIGLAEILRNHGYETSFYHGAKNGSMGFEAFSQIAGFKQYFGLNQYPDERDYDGHWGIFDEPYLQFVLKNFNQKKGPFLGTIFTLSSHVPYTIPQHHIGKFPKGTLPIHESLGYADYSLKRFFEEAKNMEWFKKTLFIITGDHTQLSEKPEYQTDMGTYNVPLILYHPNNEINKQIRENVTENQICHHADIMPTVLDFLGFRQEKILPFGHSIFTGQCNGVALNYSQGTYRMYFNNYLSTIKDDKATVDFLKAKNDKACNTEMNRLTVKKLHQFYIQYYRNGLVDNNWIK